MCSVFTYRYIKLTASPDAVQSTNQGCERSHNFGPYLSLMVAPWDGFTNTTHLDIELSWDNLGQVLDLTCGNLLSVRLGEREERKKRGGGGGGGERERERERGRGSGGFPEKPPKHTHTHTHIHTHTQTTPPPTHTHIHTQKQTNKQTNNPSPIKQKQQQQQQNGHELSWRVGHNSNHNNDPDSLLYFSYWKCCHTLCTFTTSQCMTHILFIILFCCCFQ